MFPIKPTKRQFATVVISIVAFAIAWQVSIRAYWFDWYSLGSPQFPASPREIEHADKPLLELLVDGKSGLDRTDVVFAAGRRSVLSGSFKIKDVSKYRLSGNERPSWSFSNKSPSPEERRKTREKKCLAIRIQFERRSSLNKGRAVVVQQFANVWTHENGVVKYHCPVVVPEQPGEYQFNVDVVEYNDLAPQHKPLNAHEFKSFRARVLAP